MKVFRKTIVVCTDHSLKDEFFKMRENQMSLYDVLVSLYFGDAFSDNCNNLPNIIQIVKATVKVDPDVIPPKIIDEASKMIERMKKFNGKQISLKDELIRFVACTSAKCFVNIEMDNEFFDTLIKFTNLTNQVVVFNIFFSKALLRFVFNPFLGRYRKIIISKLLPEIKKYRNDPLKKDSMILRKSVDYENGLLSDKEIGEVIMFVIRKF